MWFQKVSIPPPQKGFFLDPHPCGNFSQAPYICLNFWALESPPSSRNFQSLPWGEYGYFLELHIVAGSLCESLFFFFTHNRLPYCCLCKVMHRKGTLLELCKCCSPYSALYQKVIIKILRLLVLHTAKVLK